MERIRFGTGMLLLGATLAFGTIAAAQAIGKALVAMKRESGVKVKGLATEDISSDLGSWTGSISVRAATLPEAYVKLGADVVALRSFLMGKGFAESAFEMSAIHSEEIPKLDDHGSRTNQVEAFRLAQSLTVTSAKPDMIASAARDATSLLGNGVNITSLQPVFVNTGIEAIKLRLLAAATDNAKARATTLVTGAGGRIGRLLSTAQGVFQIVPKDSTDVTDSGSYDTTTIQKTIKAVVTLDFEVDR